MRATSKSLRAYLPAVLRILTASPAPLPPLAALVFATAAAWIWATRAFCSAWRRAAWATAAWSAAMLAGVGAWVAAGTGGADESYDGEGCGASTDMGSE